MSEKLGIIMNGEEWDRLIFDSIYRCKSVYMELKYSEFTDGIINSKQINELDKNLKQDRLSQLKWIFPYIPLINNIMQYSYWVGLGRLMYSFNELKRSSWLYFVNDDSELIKSIIKYFSAIGVPEYKEKLIDKNFMLAHKIYEMTKNRLKQNIFKYEGVIVTPLDLETPYLVQLQYNYDPKKFFICDAELKLNNKEIMWFLKNKNESIIPFMREEIYEEAFSNWVNVINENIGKMNIRIQFSLRRDSDKIVISTEENEKIIKYIIFNNIVVKENKFIILYLPEFSMFGRYSKVPLTSLIVCIKSRGYEDSPKRLIKNIVIAYTIISLFISLYSLEYSREEIKMHALASGIAGIMARNMSHIGSHIEPGLQHKMHTFIEEIINKIMDIK